MRDEPPANFYTIGSDRMYLVGTALVVMSYVIEAPLRFALIQVSLGPAIYLRELMMVTFIGLSLLCWARGQRSATLVFVVMLLLIAHTLIGVLTLESVRQPIFGLKVFLPLVFGLVVGPLMRGYTRQVTTLAWWCFGLTAVGLIVNSFIEFPWTGMSFESLSGTQELSRQWWTPDGARLAGFTRASYLAAQIVLVCLVPILTTKPRWWLRIAIVVLAGVSVQYTTSKAAYTGLAALLAIEVLEIVRGTAALSGGMIAALFLVCTALPIISIEIGVGSGPVPGWAESFVERIVQMWPQAFNLIDNPISAVIGRGIGGIGGAQLVEAEAQRFNSADNVMVFAIVTFGIAGPIYIGLLVTRLATNLSRTPLTATLSWVRGWVLISLAVGLTSQLFEDPLSNLALGISTALLFAPATVREPALAS